MNKKKKVLGDVKKFTVKRKRWLRGKGEINSKLLTPRGTMCCLGFYARECGIPKAQILNVLSPIQIEQELTYYGDGNADGKEWNTKLVKNHQNSKTCQKLMVVNDEIAMEDQDREKKIKSLFKKIGITVKFED